MGFFDFFKKKDKKTETASSPKEEKAVPEKQEPTDEPKPEEPAEPEPEPEKQPEEPAEEAASAAPAGPHEDKQVGPYFVSPHPDGGWQVKKAKAKRALKRFETKAEAQEYAKQVAKNQGTKVVRQKKDGKIQKEKY